MQPKYPLFQSFTALPDDNILVKVALAGECSLGVCFCPKGLPGLPAFVTVDARGPGPPTVAMVLMYSLHPPMFLI